jgi:PKD repeat protein
MIANTRTLVLRAAAGLALVAAATVAAPFAEPAAAGLTPHQREIASGTSATSSASFALTLPSGASTVAGRHLVVAYLFSGSSFESVTSVTDTKGNAYRIDVTKTNTGSTGLQLAIASAKVSSPIGAGDKVTVVQNSTTTYHAMQVYEFDNFDPTAWADRTATGNSPTASVSVTTSATAGTSQANETLVAAVGFGDQLGSLTSGSGWNDSDLVVASGTKQKSLGVAAMDVDSAGSYAYSGQLSTANQSVAALVTYRTVESSTPTAPVASFTATPTSGTAPLSVHFTDTSTGSPTSWAWTFGDGATSTSQNPSHVYAAGTYTVGLTVANSAGSDSVTRSALITVSAGSIGFQDMSTQGAGSAPTGEKPESKLWFNDGSWWGVLFDSASQTHHIFRLDRTSQSWVDTGVVVDSRPHSRADALWDGQHLYVASHLFATSSATAAPGNPARLNRYSYDSAGKSYALDAGFPVSINDYSTETLTVDKDSTGVLWASWTRGSQVYVNRTTGGDGVWGTPFVLPVSGATSLASDDISAVAAFGHQIGVMWSNQDASAMYFAVHADGDPSGSWQQSRTAVQGPNSADDHINLKALEGDPAGHVFAAVKTSLDEAGGTNSAPLILVLARDPATGNWSSAVFGRISDCHTRPMLMLDSQRQVLHVFATAPDSGCPFSGTAGSIFSKTSPMSPLTFPLGRGTPVMRDVASPNLNNVTGSKQSVNDSTGLVVVASNDATKRYWHADLTLR